MDTTYLHVKYLLRNIFSLNAGIGIVCMLVGFAMAKAYTHHTQYIETLCGGLNHCMHVNENRIGIIAWGSTVVIIGIVWTGISLIGLVVTLVSRNRMNITN